MEKAVTVSVDCIDTEYGFTLITFCDPYIGKKLQTIRVSFNAETEEVTIKEC